ncbi:MAG: hydroxypyruvate reductase [Dehalococcoidia bacterium]|nr:MAG: hydroxypyruvate reductase [Dehalococcoidia bacterium]
MEPPALLRSVVQAALAAVEPGAAIRRALAVRRGALTVGGLLLPLRAFRRVLIVGAGKAAAPMAAAVADLVAERPVEGLVIVPHGYRAPTGPVALREAGHPLPDEAGLRATAELIELLAGANEDDLVIATLSGGASALLVAPAGDLTLEDVGVTTELLLRSGATIAEVNAVRKRLDRIKGGRLVRVAFPALTLGLVISDVVGSPLDVIASGPTVPDRSSWEEAAAVIARYQLTERLPPRVRAWLEAGYAGQLDPPLGPDDPVFTRAKTVIVADNRLAARSAARAAEEAGLASLVLTTFVEGEAREVGRVLAGVLREVDASGLPLRRPCCLVAGGETTVTVRGPGLGGRNQEVALGAALALAGVPRVLFAAIGTDGRDGPTDVAGAWVDGETVARGRAHGQEAAAALAANDSYHFFAAAGGHLRTGPTLTNVNDLYLLFAC